MEDANSLNSALDYIEEHLQDEIDYETLCKIAGMSKSNMQKTFLFAADMTLSEYIRKLRLASAAKQLCESNDKIIDIALAYGYESAAAFSRAFHAYFQQTPSEVRAQHISVISPKIRFEIRVKEGKMVMNEKEIVRIEEHTNEKVICFDVDCIDPEEKAWALMSSWCKQYIPDRTARRYVGVAPKGHHPGGEAHQNAEEHICHPYRAMMFLVGDEAKEQTLFGKEVQDAPQGLFLVNHVGLNQYDVLGNLDIAQSMMKASEAFVEFIKNTEGYDFDYQKGIFYEEHIFSEGWFQHGGLMDGFKMWVPIVRSAQKKEL